MSRCASYTHGSDSWPEDDQIPIERLVSRLVGRDESAWRYLWRRYAGRMLGLARRLIATHNWRPLAGEEEDVLVESFERLLGGIAKFRGGSYPELDSFMRMNLRFTCLQKLRIIGTFEEPTDPADLREDEADHSFGVKECEQLLRQAVSSLPAELAEIVRMNIRGYDAREVADLLGVPRQTVFDRKHRALSFLRDWLGEQSFWEFCSQHISEIRLLPEAT